MKKKKQIRLRRTYWMVLTNLYTRVNRNNDTETQIWEPAITMNDCCCSDEGYLLFKTKKDALDSYEYKNYRGMLVKITTELIK